MAKRIRAGDLRHQINIQAPSTTLDSFGQTVTSSSGWTTQATVRAAIMPLLGSEQTLARQIYPKATSRVTIEYLSTMDTTGATAKRILFGSKALAIGAVMTPDEEGWHLDLLCSEEQ